MNRRGFLLALPAVAVATKALPALAPEPLAVVGPLVVSPPINWSEYMQLIGGMATSAPVANAIITDITDPTLEGDDDALDWIP